MMTAIQRTGHMNNQIHPTLKKCKCGFTGSRSQLYKHFDAIKFVDGQLDMTKHGEVLCLVDLNNSNAPERLSA